MSARSQRYWQERVALEYLNALDESDLETIARLWEQASEDPELAALLYELNEGLEDENAFGGGFQADAARVLELACEYLPSAFSPDEPLAPLTVAEVARRLEAEPDFRRLDAFDRAAHSRLLAEAVPVCDAPGQSQFEQWLRQLGVEASPTYRRAFRKVAQLMDMARCQQQARLAAARQALPPRKTNGGGG